MREVLAYGFSRLDEKLPLGPPLLAMMIPSFAFDECDTSFWLNGTKVEASLRLGWGNYALDLVEHFAAHVTDTFNAFLSRRLGTLQAETRRRRW